MDNQAIKDYIALMPFTDSYESYDPATQDKIIFASSEQLTDEYGEDIVTEKLVALQAIYLADGYKDEHAKLKMQGVKTLRVEDLYFTYDGSIISPLVAAAVEKLLNPPATTSNTPLFGRLV